MATWFVHRNEDGSIASAHEEAQAGYAEEALDDATGELAVRGETGGVGLVKLAKDIQAEINTALKSLVDGRRLLAVKAYYLSTTDGVSLDVGVHCIARNEAQLAALATVVREEAELGDLPHAEHFPTSFVRNQPTRH